MAGESVATGHRITLAIQSLRDPIGRQALTTQHYHSLLQLIVPIQGRVPPQSLGNLVPRDRATAPVNHDPDPFRLAVSGQLHALDRQPHDCPSVGAGCCFGPPQRRQISGQGADAVSSAAVK
jgi:hypothetical protein